MESESIETEVLDNGKRDGKGRRLVSKAERERLLDAYENSGLTQRAFCERESINFHTFVYWLGKRRQGKHELGAGSQSGKSRFEEIVLQRPSGSVSRRLEVRLPGGEVVCGDDAGQVAELVRQLRG